MNWYWHVLTNYAVFDGRARRKEFWMFTLFNLIFLTAFFFTGTMLDIVMETNGLIAATTYLLYLLITFVPTIAVVVRRLHDTGKSGIYYFVQFIPLIGPFWILFLLVKEGDFGANEYGSDPKN